MSFTLRKRATFEAAHMLPQHDGKCARLHGHSWAVEIEVTGPDLCAAGPKSGMLVDFYDIGVPLKELVESHLDHWYLNERIPELPNPTSEELARWIFRRLFNRVPRLRAVIVEETCTSRCEYRPGVVAFDIDKEGLEP